MAQASMGHWDTHTGKQQQHQPRQHLVEFQGRTLCISTEKQPTTSGVVLQSLYAALHVSKTAVDALEAPWRLMCCGRFLAPEDRVPALSVLRVWTGGLKGGKGGFGAMLRAMAKQAGAKPTTDFGACRDLQGRRLRHVNDEVRLQKWQEAREAERRGEKVEETKTQSGIENWHLGVPTWAEGAKPSYMKNRRKTVLCQQWLDARKDRKAPDGAPPWWGCPRGRGCDFAHGKGELRGKGLEEFNKRHKLESSEKRQQELDRYVAASSAEEVTANMSSSVEHGLMAKAKSDKRKAKEQAETTKELLAIDMQAAGKANRTSGGECSWMAVVGSDVELTEEGEVQGASAFGSVIVVGVALRKKKWYYEVKLLTAGLMQIGWADQSFVLGDPEVLEGVGDVPGSWGYDGARQLCWAEEERDYGQTWKVGDVVGCLLDVNAGAQTASLRYSLNGVDMGVAFADAKIAPAPTKAEVDIIHQEWGLYPALSLEEGEAGIVNLGQRPFAYPPPEGFEAVIGAVTTGGAAGAAVPLPSAQSVQAAGEGGGGDGQEDEEERRTPVNLNEFECASDLAARFGPNRLKEELEKRGAKCGGTHYQRAARLFSLKGLNPEDYPQGVMAANKNKRMKKS